MGLILCTKEGEKIFKDSNKVMENNPHKKIYVEEIVCVFETCIIELLGSPTRGFNSLRH